MATDVNYDDLYSQLRAGSLDYGSALQQAAKLAGMSSADFASSDSGYRVIGNLAAAAQNKPNFYLDTTTPIQHIDLANSNIGAGQLAYTPGITQEQAANPYYQPGGAGYDAEMKAFAPKLQQIQQAHDLAARDPTAYYNQMRQSYGLTTLLPAGSMQQNGQWAPGYNPQTNAFQPPSTPTFKPTQFQAYTPQGGLASLAPTLQARTGSIFPTAGGPTRVLGGNNG